MTDLRNIIADCPFCGAKPHRLLSKVWHDQLHGDPHQDTIIKCPHLCAQMQGSEESVIDRWNTRHVAPAMADRIEALEAENARLRHAVLAGLSAVDTGRNEPLMIWRDVARAALQEDTDGK